MKSDSIPPTDSPHAGRQATSFPARIIGWPLAAVAFAFSWAWKNHVFDLNSWTQVLLLGGTVALSLAIISMGTKYRCNDLLVAGLIAFVAPAIALFLF